MMSAAHAASTAADLALLPLQLLAQPHLHLPPALHVDDELLPSRYQCQACEGAASKGTAVGSNASRGSREAAAAAKRGPSSCVTLRAALHLLRHSPSRLLSRRFSALSRYPSLSSAAAAMARPAPPPMTLADPVFRMLTDGHMHWACLTQEQQTTHVASGLWFDWPMELMAISRTVAGADFALVRCCTPGSCRGRSPLRHCTQRRWRAHTDAVCSSSCLCVSPCGQ